MTHLNAIDLARDRTRNLGHRRPALYQLANQVDFMVFIFTLCGYKGNNCDYVVYSSWDSSVGRAFVRLSAISVIRRAEMHRINVAWGHNRLPLFAASCKAARQSVFVKNKSLPPALFHLISKIASSNFRLPYTQPRRLSSLLTRNRVEFAKPWVPSCKDVCPPVCIESHHQQLKTCQVNSFPRAASEQFGKVRTVSIATTNFPFCGSYLDHFYMRSTQKPDRSSLVPVVWQQWSEMEALIPSPAACEFSEGRQSVHDEEHSGRPSLINDDRVELVRQCIMENRRFRITGLSSHFPQISRPLLHEIVTKHLLFKKVCARWVPKNLTPEHKMQRLGAALTFLQRYHDDGDEFLDRIVTGDETWISHFTPETKQQSLHW
ncbi:hypothetical protein ANN_09940 [Periplaneta americana]|uniref:Histone-lysine N-methyltransferase SETMAR n=1 Tax=Periplaneta americana TaxID=6978 RepID=A0ABQ8TPS5_PERAM|nr:hypothetical protein ANN_09940 [Periplaneta americana]